MPSKTIENIVIFSLIVIIFYMIFKLTKNENIDVLNPQYRIKSYDEKYNKKVTFNPALEDVNDKSQPSPIVKKIYHPMTNFNLNDNDLYAMTDPADNIYPRNEVNDYLDEYMNYSRFDKSKQTETTKEDLDKHRGEFFDFRNKINRDSHGFDPVDQLNLDRLSGKINNGLKISDIYDKITATNFDVSSIGYLGKDLAI